MAAIGGGIEGPNSEFDPDPRSDDGEGSDIVGGTEAGGSVGNRRLN